jgi:hypothetical protein
MKVEEHDSIYVLYWKIAKVFATVYVQIEGSVLRTDTMINFLDVSHCPSFYLNLFWTLDPVSVLK